MIPACRRKCEPSAGLITVPLLARRYCARLTCRSRTTLDQGQKDECLSRASSADECMDGAVGLSLSSTKRCDNDDLPHRHSSLGATRWHVWKCRGLHVSSRSATTQCPIDLSRIYGHHCARIRLTLIQSVNRQTSDSRGCGGQTSYAAVVH